MGDVPSTITTYYGLGKWNNGNNPSSDGLNRNWEIIDAAIHAAAGSGPEQIQYIFNGPLSSTGNSVSLNFTDNLKVTAGSLDTAQNIKTTGAPQFAKLGLGMACTANYLLEAAGSGHFSGDVVVDGDFVVNGDTVVLNAYELAVKDKNITLNNSEDISDITAAGGGITLKGTTDKSLIWNNDGYGWTSSEHINLALGKSFKINGSDVLKGDTLGAGVVNSSLTKVGTLSQGTWQATPIDRAYVAAGTANHIVVNGADGKLSSLAALNVGRGGTGLTSFTSNKVYKGNGTNSLVESSITDDGTNTTIAPSGAFYFDTGTGNILPKDKYFENLGSLTNKYLTLHAAELWVNTLVAQNTIATIGGRVAVAPTSTLILDLAPSDQIMYVKHNQMVMGDIVYLESAGKVEFIMIDSGATPVAGGYSYAIFRNFDGSGANQWYAGDALMNTGQTGNGFIDIYSVRGIKSSTQAGPTIVGNVRNSSTYNDWSEHWALGNLNGLYGYLGDTYGIGIGKYGSSSSYLTYDVVDGLCFKNKTAEGVERISIQLKQDGSGFIGNGYMKWNASNLVTVGGWDVYLDKLINGSTRLENSATFKGLAINNGVYDSMKIGDFTINNFADSPSNLTGTYISNATFNSGWTGWTHTGSGATQSIVSGGSDSGSYLLINCTNYTTLAFSYDIRQSFANPTSLQGKHIKVPIALKLGDWYDAGTGNHPTVQAPVTVALANQNGAFFIKKFTPGSNWADFTAEAVVPIDSTIVTLIMSGSYTSPQYYYSTCIDNIRLLVYDKSYNYQNSLGISMYNSPWNFLKMQGGSFSMGVSNMTVNGYKPVLFDTTQPDKPIGPMLCKVNGAVVFYDGTGWTELALA